MVSQQGAVRAFDCQLARLMVSRESRGKKEGVESPTRRSERQFGELAGRDLVIRESLSHPENAMNIRELSDRRRNLASKHEESGSHCAQTIR